uniref:(California timema) hypothetical protein n=1 Tax=Timema californicum TaxID=61474 RepID=A0A7R9JET9_TIMCA|nr:unnamed protein product [Timema californicum]
MEKCRAKKKEDPQKWAEHLEKDRVRNKNKREEEIIQCQADPNILCMRREKNRLRVQSECEKATAKPVTSCVRRLHYGDVYSETDSETDVLPSDEDSQSESSIASLKSPEIREDLISMYTTSAHGVMALSLGKFAHTPDEYISKAQRKTVGYFVYDLMDMMINHRKRSSYELMVHHVVVIICFGLSVMTRYYLGYGLMALLVEVNSIFLHIRQLMLIQSLRKSHILYRLNSLLTIGTFIVFRITTLGWMTRWLVLHRDELTVTAFAIGSASMPVIMVMNIVLFLRILNSDYRQRKPTNNDGFLNTLHQEEPLCNQDKTD